MLAIQTYYYVYYLFGYASALSGHMCVTSLRLTLENTSLWLEEYITVGLSEQAKTLVDESDRNLLKVVGCVPRTT